MLTSCPFRRASLPASRHMCRRTRRAGRLPILGILAAGSVLIASPAHAQSAPAGRGAVYAGIGLPGVMLGYAHPLNERLTLRADISTIGNWDRDVTKDGLDYKGSAKLNRAALLADYHVNPSFRLTGGVTYNDMRVDLDTQGRNELVDIGDTTVLLTPADRVEAEVRFPRVTPYIGIGFGRHTGAPGWSVVADLGVSIGRAKVDGRLRGPAAALVPQSEVDKELREIRDDVSIGVVPQISVGVAYRF